jgi:arylsulfatase A-like enzyme
MYRWIVIVALLLIGWSGVVLAEEQRETPPNVLIFTIDDMNDWTTVFDPANPIQTPRIAELASRGVFFERAYCASPACNPSRVATWTGLRPTSSGVYGNKTDWRRALPDRLTLMQQFQAAGYEVEGAGKVFHHHMDGAFHDDASFDEFRSMRPQLYPPQKLNGAPRYGSKNTDWGAWPPDPNDSIDIPTADYCIERLRAADRERPLFLVCGIFKPHSPFFAPEAYHEPYAEIELPLRRDDDWDDLPSGATSLAASKAWFWRGMMDVENAQPGSYHDFIRSYAACCAFADDQVGRMLDALDESGRADDTIVVLWSDHGFHLGEKDHIEKFVLWERANHIPLIFAGPGIVENARCECPVDMTLLYPTLLEVCGLPPDSACDGVSVVPLLENPDAEWNRPALMTYMPGNHAVRSERWRYIRYADGTEELYDHTVDPYEWRNLCQWNGRETVPQQAVAYDAVLDSHRRWIPTEEAAKVSDMKAR